MTEIPKRIESRESRLVSGALFDFMAYLTAREKEIKLGSSNECGVAVEAIQEFADMRNLSLEEADVQGWRDSF